MQMRGVFLTKTTNTRQCLFVKCASVNDTTMGVQRYLVSANATYTNQPDYKCEKMQILHFL